MNKKSVVRLGDGARAVCVEVVKKLKGISQMVRRAQILLQVDAGGPNWTVERAAEAIGCPARTVEYWVIPPEADAEFVPGMEAVLDL